MLVLETRTISCNGSYLLYAMLSGHRPKWCVSDSLANDVCHCGMCLSFKVPSHSKVYIYLIRSNIVGFLNAEGVSR